jgi:hypothetical protein
VAWHTRVLALHTHVHLDFDLETLLVTPTLLPLPPRLVIRLVKVDDFHLPLSRLFEQGNPASKWPGLERLFVR